MWRPAPGASAAGSERRRERGAAGARGGGPGAAGRPGGRGRPGPRRRLGVRRGGQGRAGRAGGAAAGSRPGKGRESGRAAGIARALPPARRRPGARGSGARARFRFCGVGGSGARTGFAGAILCCFRRRRWLKSTSPSPAGSAKPGESPQLPSGERGSIYLKKRAKKPPTPQPSPPSPFPSRAFCTLAGGSLLHLYSQRFATSSHTNLRRHRAPPAAALLSFLSAPPCAPPGRDPRPEALEETNPASRRRARPPCLWLSDPSWLPPAFLLPCSLCSSSLWLPCLYRAIAAL